MELRGQATKLELREISCIRGGRLLFENLSLGLRAGEAALVTGPNGAGKSSLLRLIAGLLEISDGSIAREGSIAWLGDALPLDPQLGLARALGYWAKFDGIDVHIVDASLEALNMLALRDVPVRMLSTGQRKRAGLAMTFATKADIVLLDEPVNGLDADATRRVEAMAAKARSDGAIIVAASHIPFALPGAVKVHLEGGQ